MTPEELLAEWEDGEPGMTIKRVNEVRDYLVRYTDLSIPRQHAGIQLWVNVMVETGTVSRRLRECSERVLES